MINFLTLSIIMRWQEVEMKILLYFLQKARFKIRLNLDNVDNDISLYMQKRWRIYLRNKFE